MPNDVDQGDAWDTGRRALETGERLQVHNDAVLFVDPERQDCSAGPNAVAVGDAYSLLADAVVQPGGQITWFYWGPPGAAVSIRLTRLTNTGGHQHPNSGDGPAGTAVPSAFTLGPNYPQNHRVVVTGPDAGGVVVMTSRFSPGNPSVITNTIHVSVPGLVAFGGGVGIVLTGATRTHPTNHYAVPELANLVAQLGQRYFRQFSRAIFVNDMSLADGGLFDHRATWRPPHQTHRDGRRVDINSTSMTPEQQAFFRQAAQELGFRTVTLETNPPHWHLEV